MKKNNGLVLAAVSLSATLVAPAGAAGTYQTVLVSRATGASGAKSNGDSEDASISTEGRFVAFTSTATNLSVDDATNDKDVYVRDVLMNVTTLVSRATGSSGTKGNGDSARSSISADGRFVAFASTATNLSPDDTTNDSDIYVRDLQTNVTTLVSRATGLAGAKGNALSLDPVISADGRLIAFESIATNLSPDDAIGDFDVYVRDLQTNVTTLVSRASGPSGTKGNSHSFNPSISAAGVVSFDSLSTNLDAGDTNPDTDVYVRDPATNQTSLVSRATGPIGAKGNAGSGDSSISAGGRFVAFESDATNLIAADTTSDSDLYVRDLLTNETTLISRYQGKNGTKANGSSLDPSISANGLLIAFDTNATNLEAIDPSTDDDVYVRDQTTKGLTTLLSRVSGFNGVKGNGDSFNPSISSKDGRCVAFESNATNLSPDDTSSDSDIYVRQQR